MSGCFFLKHGVYTHYSKMKMELFFTHTVKPSQPGKEEVNIFVKVRFLNFTLWAT